MGEGRQSSAVLHGEWGECMGKALSCACTALTACVLLELDVQASDCAFHVFTMVYVCFEIGVQLGIKLRVLTNAISCKGLFYCQVWCIWSALDTAIQNIISWWGALRRLSC